MRCPVIFIDSHIIPLPILSVLKEEIYIKPLSLKVISCTGSCKAFGERVKETPVNGK